MPRDLMERRQPEALQKTGPGTGLLSKIAIPRRLALALPAFAAGAMLWFGWSGHVGCYSYHFHADELGKIRQLETGERNFNHPLLLLETARVFAQFSRADDNPHDLAVAGRLASLAFASLAAGSLALWIGLLRGPALAWIAAIWLGFHPRLVTYGHHFKEDTALLFGMAAGLAALAAWNGRSRGWAGLAAPCLAGIAAGLAASGKYIGFLWTFGLVFAIAAAAGRKERFLPGALAILCAALVFLAVNHRMILDWPQPWVALTGEVGRATGQEPTVTVSKAGYFERIFSRPNETLFPYGLILGAFVLISALANLLRRRGGVGLTDLCGRGRAACASILLAFAFAILYGALLAKSDKLAERYWLPLHLPVGALGWVALHDLWKFVRNLAGRAPQPLLRKLADPFVVAMALGLAAAIVIPSVRKGLRHGKRFERVEDREALIDFIRNTLPAGSKIAYGRRVGLPDPAYPEQYAWQRLPFIEQQVFFVEETDEIINRKKLVAGGFTHVALNEEVVRLWRKRREGSGRPEEFFQSARAIYQGSSTGRDEFPARLGLYETGSDANRD